MVSNGRPELPRFKPSIRIDLDMFKFVVFFLIVFQVMVNCMLFVYLVDNMGLR